jgi:hypothetical protein
MTILPGMPVNELVKWWIGLIRKFEHTTGASANPITRQLDHTGTFKYTRRKTSGQNHTYQYSITFSDPWTAFTPVTNPPAAASISDTVEEVAVVVPPSLLAGPKLFLRVKAE